MIFASFFFNLGCTSLFLVEKADIKKDMIGRSVGMDKQSVQQ